MRGRRGGGPRPKEISDLVRDLLRARAPANIGGAAKDEKANEERRAGQGTAMFLIGAGCSKSAGIPLASEVAQSAIVALERDYRAADPSRAGSAAPADAKEALTALVEGEHVPPRFMPADGPPRWGELYSYIFSEHIKHPNHQRALLATLVDTDELGLNWSHACLGELVNLRFVHTVMTTNFDQLVLKGIIRTGIIPVVADGLESLIRISATPRWPQVVHVHGSMHTYELRNSYDALLETEDDAGLQSLMLSLLKETTVLVVVGYSGGEEGIMHLLQRAAASLPRMVVYWITRDSDYADLSDRARTLLETGEYKYFVLGQDSDDFFNRLLGELGVGPPGWIKRPLAVLEDQAKIAPPPNASNDVQALIAAYADRVAYAVEHGEREDSPIMEATELRSANRFKEAATRIEAMKDFRQDEAALRIHATSLFDLYNDTPEPDEAILDDAITELELLVGLDGPRPLSDIETLIEARRDKYERLLDDSPDRRGVAQNIADAADAAQKGAAPGSRDWALMEFYKAEAAQLKAEQLKGDTKAKDPEVVTERGNLLTSARNSYEQALPKLTTEDAIRARECKEGLAGALTGMAELRPNAAGAKANLRQAKALFQEVVEFAARNTPGRELGGALENLAGVIETTIARHPEDANTARNEAKALFQKAKEVYAEIDNSAGIRRMQSKLIDYRD